MDLAKFFVAVGISLLLMSFFAGALSTFYKPPKVDTSSCYSSGYSYSNDCYDQQETLCGDDIDCRFGIYSSNEYQTCIDNQQNQRQECISNAQSKLKTYTYVYYVILALLGIILMAVGFLFVELRSISAGLIGGGVLLLLFAGLFASILGFASSLSSYALSPETIGYSPTGITGFATSSSDTSILSYL